MIMWNRIVACIAAATVVALYLAGATHLAVGFGVILACSWNIKSYRRY